MKNKKLIILIVILIFISALPVLIGLFRTDGEQIYSGVVFNPIDGYTYLSKMQIGWSGDWWFTLPFSAQAGEGRILYPFYISAGHLARFLGISLALLFNILRLASYGLLILALNRLAGRVFPENSKLKTFAVFLMAAGGGSGWLLLPFGKFGADFWVAEAFPYLSGLANAHFPLAICLLVASVLMLSSPPGRFRLLALFLAAVLLSVLSPFGFVVAAIVSVISGFWEKVEGKALSILPVIVFVLSGIPYCAYQYWAVNSTPQLAAWTAQNQTPSPQIWDVVLSFSPWIILILFGWKDLFRLRESPVVRRLLVWMAVGLILTIIPISLQRRFMFGLSVPITCLGLLGLPYVAERLRISTAKMKIFCVAAALPTPLLLLIMTSTAIAARNPLYYFRADELNAIQWIKEHDPDRSIILAAETTGSMIPAVSRLRVLYGHPFETIQAEDEKKVIIDFFSGNMPAGQVKSYLTSKQVDWILWGPRERELGKPEFLVDQQPARQFGEVSLYHLPEILP